VVISWEADSLSNHSRNMTTEDTHALAGAISGIALGLVLGYYSCLHANARAKAEAKWIEHIYKNVTNTAQRKRLLYTPRCDLSTEELLMLTPPAYRPRK